MRSGTALSLTVVACPQAVAATDCFSTYPNRTVLDGTATVSERTLGIYDKDGTSPLRLQLIQGAGPMNVPPPECHLVDVAVRSDTVRLVVTLGTPLAFTCAPSDRCTPAGSCGQ